LAYIAYRLGRDTKGLLIGEAARPEQREALRRTILAHPEVEVVLELLTMYLGPVSLLVAVRLDLRDGLSSQQVEAVSTRIEAELAEVVPEVTQVFLDPTPRERHRHKAEAPTSWPGNAPCRSSPGTNGPRQMVPTCAAERSPGCPRLADLQQVAVVTAESLTQP
jgi:hypothetical protein